MMKNLLDWLDNRTGYRHLVHEMLYEPIPGGARWRYVWGSALVYTFVLQVISGVFLWTAYSPSAQTAWESVYYIQNEMWLGNIVRGIHHFAAQLMVVLLAIHLMQVIIDGAYKAPREVNFWLGLVLMQIVLGLSLTGYLLPWDQKGYYATQVSTKIMGVTPVVGATLQEIAQGGPEYGHQTLTRFFAMHAGILPGLLIAFLTLHIYVFRRHGITVKDPDHAPTAPFWPDQVFKDAVISLGILAVVLSLAIFKGAELSAPASSDPYDAARPEWYFLFLFRFLKFEFVESFGMAFGAIYVPGALMTILILMPLIAHLKYGHSFNVAFMWVVTVVIIGLTGLALYEDANDTDHQAAIAEAHRDGQRAVELAQGPEKIPVGGALELLRDDPFTQGPRIFAARCSSCHRYNGHNGRGRVLMEISEETGEQTIMLPTAPDLGNFGSREWMRTIVTDFTGHFAPIMLSSHFQEMQASGEGEYIDPVHSEMADWSGDQEALTGDENKANLDALVEFMVQEAAHARVKIDADKAERGREVATEGAWAGELEGTSCADCHETIGKKFTANAEADYYGYPDMAEYASAKWLKAFLKNPGSTQFYGKKNQMPAFQDLPDDELDLLVRWLVKDYPETHVHDYESHKAELSKKVQQAVQGDLAGQQVEAE